MVVLILSPQLMISKFQPGLTLKSRSKCLSVVIHQNHLAKEIHVKKPTQSQLHFNQTNVSTLDLTTNKDPETPISFLPPSLLMELELSLSSTTKLVIKIKNGISTTETGLLSTELTLILLSIPRKELIEELSSLNQMVAKDKLLIIIPITTK